MCRSNSSLVAKGTLRRLHTENYMAHPGCRGCGAQRVSRKFSATCVSDLRGQQQTNGICQTSKFKGQGEGAPGTARSLTWGSCSSCMAAKASAGCMPARRSCFFTVCITRFSFACFFFFDDTVPCIHGWIEHCLRSQRATAWHYRSSPTASCVSCYHETFQRLDHHCQLWGTAPHDEHLRQVPEFLSTSQRALTAATVPDRRRVLCWPLRALH